YLIVQCRVRSLLLHFRMVQGLDASAALSLSKLHQLCGRYHVTLILSGLRPEHQAVLQQMRFLPHPEIHLVSDLDRGMEWMEDRLLAGAHDAPGTAPTFVPSRANGARGDAASVDLRGMLGAHFSPEALQVLLDLCEQLDIPQETVLMRRGDAGDALYFVERGEVSVMVHLEDGKRRRLRTLGPGSMVGEMALYSGQPRSADVVTETPCRAYRLTAERFARLDPVHPPRAIESHSLGGNVLARWRTGASGEIRALL